MASGFLKGAVDLDSLFLARVNTKRADVGFAIGATDISNRYEPRGSATAIAATGFVAAAGDLANLFRDINVPLVTHTVNASSSVSGSTTSIGFWGTFALGSVSPTTYLGTSIEAIMDQTDTGTPANTGFRVTFPGALASTFFTSITINGFTFLTSAATLTVGAFTTWKWATKANLVNAGVYPLAFA